MSKADTHHKIQLRLDRFFSGKTMEDIDKMVPPAKWSESQDAEWVKNWRGNMVIMFRNYQKRKEKGENLA